MWQDSSILWANKILKYHFLYEWRKKKCPAWNSEKFILFGPVTRHGSQPSWTWRGPPGWPSSTSSRERIASMDYRWWTQSRPTLEETVRSVDLLHNFSRIFVGYKKLPLLKDGDRRARAYLHENIILQNYSQIHFLGDFSLNPNLSNSLEFSDLEQESRIQVFKVWIKTSTWLRF